MTVKAMDFLLLYIGEPYNATLFEQRRGSSKTENYSLTLYCLLDDTLGH